MTRSVVTRETGSMVKPSLIGGVRAVELGDGAALSTGAGAALAVSVVGSAVGLALADGLGAALLETPTSVSTGTLVVEVAVWLLPQPVSIRTPVASRAQAEAKRAGVGVKAMGESILWLKGAGVSSLS